jgi:hypothetical protein
LAISTEAAIAVHRDHYWGRQSLFQARRLRIERFAELHDVHALLAERRADRRAGVRLTRRDLQLDVAGNFLSHWYISRRLRANSSPEPMRPRPLKNQPFSTCEKSSSTGVERPRIWTATCSRFFS